ncbi:MFS transporter [Umezawaea sp.]|uniref:MFS transporter n=1 Tax=Umezawaea sp. TaxID=1955258 RepID=UPI002ED66195
MRSFVFFTTAYSLSVFGTYLNLIVLSLFTFQLTDSALGTGAALALRVLSGFVSGVPAGRLAGRADRWLMIGADLARAAAVVALLLWPGIPALVVACVVLGAGNTVFTVALRSAVPDLVGQENRTRANGYLVTGRAVATVLGLASAGTIIPVGGFQAAFAITAASFLCCAAAVALLPRRAREVTSADTTPPALRHRFALGWVVVCLLVLRAADALGSASHNVALPLYAEQNGAVAFMSYFMTAWAVGTLCAHPLVTRWVKRRGAPPSERAFAVGTCLMSVSFVVAFTGVPTPVVVVAAAVAGLADGFTEICYVSRFQAMPEHQRGRLFGLSASVEAAGFAAGTVAAGFLLGALPVPVAVGLLHGATCVAAAAFLLLFTLRGNRSALDSNRTQGTNH